MHLDHLVIKSRLAQNMPVLPRVCLWSDLKDIVPCLQVPQNCLDQFQVTCHSIQWHRQILGASGAILPCRTTARHYLALSQVPCLVVSLPLPGLRPFETFMLFCAMLRWCHFLIQSCSLVYHYVIPTDKPSIYFLDWSSVAETGNDLDNYNDLP